MGQNTLIISKPSSGQSFSDPLSPIKKMKNQKKIQLSSGRWDRLNLDEAVEDIMEWKVQFLLLSMILKRVDQNFKPSILPQILNINFSKIKYLSLAENRITSMEMVSRIKMPSIEYLVLSKNLSNNMSSIRKIQCPKLVYLNISYNFSSNLMALSEMNLPRLGELKFQDLGQRRQCEDMSWIARIEPKNMNRIVCLSTKRIGQQKAKKKLMKKYPEAQFKMLHTQSSCMDLTLFPFYVFDSL